MIASSPSRACSGSSAVKAVQELMGHATIEMTLRYSHLSREVGRGAVQLLDRHGNSRATGTNPSAN